MKINNMECPLLDGFYDSPCFLTAEKCTKDKLAFAKEYCEKNKIDTAILVFNRALLSENIDEFLPGAVYIGYLRAGEDTHPIWAYNGVVLTVPFVGGPCASGTLEELNVIGIKKVIATGSAGLIANFDESKLFIIERAIRDEGTSLTYEAPSLYTYPSESLTKEIKDTFDKLGIEYDMGTTWTYDNFYKESKDRIELRRSQGASVVEMECATWCVTAKHLGMEFAQFLFFSDKVARGDWSRSVHEKDKLGIRNTITLLCLEIVKNI